MKSIFLVFLLSATAVFAERASFASQSDLVADLSDSVLNGIFHHQLGTGRCACERGIWLEGFGSYRERLSTSQRSCYDNKLGGILGGFNYALSCTDYFNLFVGGSWGEIDICNASPCFDTNSFFAGMTWEHFCGCRFFGFTIAGGVLREERNIADLCCTLTEKPRGVFLTSEIAYAQKVTCGCLSPIFRGTLRYAGFFAGDYQHCEVLGTLYVKERSIQLLTLRGEFTIPIAVGCFCFEPYFGGAGRFQVDGNRVHGRLLLSDISFSDGIDCSIGYALAGVRASKQIHCLDLQANVEFSYDTDQSWRTLGELTLSYRY